MVFSIEAAEFVVAQQAGGGNDGRDPREIALRERYVCFLGAFLRPGVKDLLAEQMGASTPSVVDSFPVAFCELNDKERER